MDYHNSAICIAMGNGMHRVDNQQPIYWRTPGYPWFLSLFYKWQGLKSPKFELNANAQKNALWVQIILSSVIPLLIFALAYLITRSLSLASVASWITVFHLGFVLASGFLLTEAIALIFFFLFLFFFYQGFSWWREPEKKNGILYLCLSALNLAIYTWMRPNGVFFAYLCIALLIASSGGWKQRIWKNILCAAVFFMLLSPWYYRNYELTGHWFFRRVTGNPLDLCLRYLLTQAKKECDERTQIMKITNPTIKTCMELIAGEFAWPWITKYPHYFIYDWCKEVCKTAFDPSASQLVAIAASAHKYDQIEEFLTEKVKNCAYKQPMSKGTRIICWLDMLYLFLLWFGVLVAGITILVRVARRRVTDQEMCFLLSCTFIFGCITGCPLSHY
jgi:4-amino-4-deoxy-L-arabinose transferase-like glycosyltransferase